MSPYKELTRSTSTAEGKQVHYSNIIAALSFALDLTEGACPGHAVRTCVLGMRLAQEMGLPEDLLSDAYYALLLKDVGCSSNAARLYQVVGDDEMRAKQLTKTVDWTRLEWKQMHYLLKHAHSKKPPMKRLGGIRSMLKDSSKNAEVLIRLRCEQGAKVVRDLGLGPAAAGAIYCLDEHWDGRGYPDGLVGEDIPLLARLVSLAQTLEVFHRLYGAAAAMDIIQQRSGRWFDPSLVRAVVAMNRRGVLWQSLDAENLDSVAALEPRQKRFLADSFVIDNICVAFAGVVDAKSPYTYTHSTGVARTAVQIGQKMQLRTRDLTILRRAGLLHDIGKLSVPNCILDKAGPLTPTEWECVRKHPSFTYEILNRISGFGEIATIAASHHEKLDGSGYHLGLKSDQLGLMARILTVADMYDALSGDRPYRAPLGIDQVMSILKKDAPHAIDEHCLAALETFVDSDKVVA